MADLSITPANVTPGTNAQERSGLTAFEAMTAGQVVIQRSDRQIQLADATDDTLDEVFGILTNSPAAGQPCSVQVSGTINLGTGTQGVPYFLSEANPGGIAPIADLVTSGSAVQGLGVANGSGINIQLQNSGIDIP